MRPKQLPGLLFLGLDLLLFIGSPIWLLILGKWTFVVAGIVVIPAGAALLSLALYPCGAILWPAANRVRRHSSLFFAALPPMYAASILIAWSVFCFWFFADGSGYRDFLPTAMWSYVVAAVPLIYCSTRKRGCGIYLVSGATQLGYLAAGLLIFLHPSASLVQPFRVFLLCVAFGAAAQAYTGAPELEHFER